MADKAFGVDQLDILGNGTPTISAPNQLNLDCHTVAISTSVTVGANLTVNGNIDLGNASSDTISLTGVVDTNIIPSADSSKDIGSNSVRFANGYFDTVYGSGANLTNLPTIAGIWTVTNNSSSNYVITGPGGLSSANNPDLYLERGKTYQFAMNASGHGFGIQTSSGTWNQSNEYTTGITNPRADTGTITFAVPYNAPARLYYACTSSHSGMVGNLYIQGAASTVDVSNNADNRVITGGSGGSLNGESSLTFDGTTLGLTGNQTVSGTVQVAGNSNFGAASASPSPSALTVKMATNKHIGFSPSQSEVGDVPALVAFQDNGSLASIGFRGDDVRFAAGSTEVIRITSDGRIGINKTNPNNYELDIWNRSSADDAQIRLYNNGTGSGQHTIMRFQIAGTSASNYIYFGDSGDANAGQIRYNHGNNAMTFHTNGTLQMQIRSSGAVQKPNNPIFFAYMDAQASHNSGDALKLDHTELNVGSGYNTSNYKFTPPVDGHYMFHAAANFSLGNGEFTRAANVRLYKNGSGLTYQIGRNSLTGYQSSYPSTDGTFMVYGTTSDEFTCVVSWETGGGNFSNLNSSETLHPHGTKFMGYLIG